MSINKYLVNEDNKLLKGKLEALLKKLVENKATENIQTEENLLIDAFSILKTFYSTPGKSIFKYNKVFPDTPVDKNFYNKLWEDILDDLTILFSALENIETAEVENFNFINTEIDNLTNRLKKISSLCGDYALFTNDSGVFYISDSFNDSSKIEANSPLLNDVECEVNQEEGVLTLPIVLDTELISLKDITVNINPISNGILGNNQQLNAKYNGDVSAALDNNPDTWFEYERVIELKETDEAPLILDITLILKTPDIINYLRINPNNFGTKTTINIKDILTSYDGIFYTSIKDDIPINNIATLDEPNEFILAPSSSKYAGQGIFTFTPRKTKYVHIILEQPESFLIQTPAGEKKRFAIGIRDIDIQKKQYKSAGELVTSTFDFEKEITKVSLATTQNPLNDNELCSFEYYLSADNGQRWTQIAEENKKETSGEKSLIPEILNFNNSDESSINTDTPINSIKFKIKLKRNDSAFTDNSTSYVKNIKETSEIHSIPETSPFLIDIEKVPIESSLSVIDPSFGSRGIENSPYVISGTGSLSGSTSLFYLPFKIKRPLVKIKNEDGTYSTNYANAEDWIYCKVEGERWAHATAPLRSYTANYSTSSAFKLFTFDHEKGIIQFGTGYNTCAPKEGSPITLYFEAERVFPLYSSNNHTFLLEFPTSNNKNEVKILNYGETEKTLEIIPQGVSLIRLKNKNIDDTSDITTVLLSLGFATKVEYVNGKEELDTSTKWSIDQENGIIYLGGNTSLDEDSTFTYTFKTVTELTPDDWDWVSSEKLKKTITIKDSAWKTIEKDSVTLVVGDGTTQITLPDLAIVRNTIDIDLTNEEGTEVENSENPFLREVEFIDGDTEFNFKRTVKMFSENLGMHTYNGFSGSPHRIVLPDRISVEDATFQDSMIFKTRVMSLQENNAPFGTYFLDTDKESSTYRTLFLSFGSATSLYLGNIMYTKLIESPGTGAYSICYDKGIIYTDRPLNENWTLNISYQYTDYRVKYKIAREVPFEYDKVNQQILFSDSEVQNKLSLPRGSNIDRLNYQVIFSYVDLNREGISDLLNYYTPVVKDYALKIVTKDMLINGY